MLSAVRGVFLLRLLAHGIDISGILEEYSSSLYIYLSLSGRMELSSPLTLEGNIRGGYPERPGTVELGILFFFGGEIIMATYFCNTFAIGMLDKTRECTVYFEPMTMEDAKGYLSKGFIQAVGHPSTCQVLTAKMGIEVIPNRLNVRLLVRDILIVAEVVVPRLAEGQILSKEEVEQLPLSFWYVSVSPGA